MTSVTMRRSSAPTNEAAPARRASKSKADDLIVEDSRGRKLKIRKLTLLEEMNLLAVAGAERAAIQRWMMYASVITTVRSIDGDPVEPPLSLRVLNGIISQVGAEGFAAAAEALASELPPDALEAADDDVVGSAKNL